MVNEPTYTLDVAGVGLFRFKRKTRIRNQLAMEAIYEEATNGVQTLSPTLEALSRAYAGLKVLTVEAPSGWDLDTLDLSDNADGDKLLSVWRSVLEKENFFRAGGAQDGAPGR